METNKPSQAQTRRAVQIIFALAGKSASGQSVTEIASKIGVPTPMVFRDLEIMASERAVERHPHNAEKWRLTPRFVQISHVTSHEIANVMQNASQFAHQYGKPQ
ncbi:MAG: hypothetical protein ORN98_03225 [Alphaproteobacteria bacterium]|nr:hypothetical protein [Alphaproteobacteria bacterium]